MKPIQTQKYRFSGESLKKVLAYLRENPNIFTTNYQISKKTHVNLGAVGSVISFLKEIKVVETELSQSDILLIKYKEMNYNDTQRTNKF